MKKQRNSKARFLLIVLAGALVGGVLGGLLMRFGHGMFMGAGAFAAGVHRILLPLWGSIWLVLGIASLALYRKAKGQMLAYAQDPEQEGEDEGSKVLAVGMLVNAINMILSFGFFGFSFSAADHDVRMPNIMVGILLFILVITFCVTYEVKSVALTRRCQPEKKGDPLDIHFQKEWMDSCDEAEKLIVYTAAYKTFQLLRIVIIGCWVVAALGAMYLGFGPIPVIFVTGIWMTHTVGYLVYSMREDKGNKGSPSAGGVVM